MIQLPRGLFSRDWPPPQGFRKLPWLSAKEGDEVYIMDLVPPGSDDRITTTKARGPYRIVDLESRKLIEVTTGGDHRELGERLCVPGAGTYEVWWRLRRSWRHVWGLFGRVWVLRASCYDLARAHKCQREADTDPRVDASAIWLVAESTLAPFLTTRQIDARGMRVEPERLKLEETEGTER